MFNLAKKKDKILEIDKEFQDRPLEQQVYNKPQEPELTDQDFITALQQIYSEIINLKQDVMDLRQALGNMKQVSFIIQAQEEKKK